MQQNLCGLDPVSAGAADHPTVPAPVHQQSPVGRHLGPVRP